MNPKGNALGLAVAAVLAGAPAWAAGTPTAPGDDKGKAEDIGIVTGLAVGAAAGGPVGAMIGAAAGGLMGDRYHRQKQTAAELSSALSESRTHGAQLEQTLAGVDEVGMDLSFRTDDAAIRVEDLAPLLKLGALAVAMPDSRLRVAGYADPRGPAVYNEALSARRAEAVASALTQAGLPRERLIVEAHGCAESTSSDGDLDAYALDRRVTVRLERRGPPAPVKVASSVARPGAGS
ncbi:MAG TPA: OmpA family protein [Steroidobacteraceae bacterium]|nr:OmpA family protein [Steroidobacteraceae bacterium]